jgi:cysteine-S-conjugate beta-lyase
VSFNREMEKNGIHGPNPFGVDALIAAYRHGEEWLDLLLEYLEGNLSFLEDFIEERIPRVRVTRTEGTYLVWLDFRALGIDADALKAFMRDKARVALDDGYIFGRAEGAGFERINIACPRSVLREALERIEKAVKSEE